MGSVAVQRTRIAPVVLIIAVAAIALSACATSGPGAPSPLTTSTNIERGQPPGVDVTFQWIDTPEFDPLSSEGTFVRAYVESYELARDGVGTEWGYPGFADASPPGIDEALNDDQLGLRFSSTVYYRLLRRTAEDTSTSITLCRYGVASIRAETHWEFGSWPPRPVHVSFNTTGAAPPAGERGPHRAPTNDVFGDWKVTASEFIPPEPRNGQPSEHQECRDNVSGLPPMPPTEPEQRSEPVPPQRSSPGWPAAGL